MRNRIFIISIICLNILHLNAIASADSTFVAANENYAEGNYEKAYDTYLTIINRGLESPELYYNMGNAAFRSNKLGYAILYYKKALKLEPGFEEAERNLQYVSTYKEDQLEEVPEFFLKTWFKKLFGLFSLNTWSAISLFFFIAILAGLVLYIFASRLSLKKTGFFSAVAGLILFVISIAATVNRHKEVLQPEKAVILSPSVVVKSSPSLTGTDLFILHEGTTVSTDETVGEWTEIRISDGRIGWIPKETIGMI